MFTPKIASSIIVKKNKDQTIPLVSIIAVS